MRERRQSVRFMEILPGDRAALAAAAIAVAAIMPQAIRSGKGAAVSCIWPTFFR